jgi:thiosulfate/3-mercaptopyruvate sulfurtransferase
MDALVEPAWLEARLGDPSLRILESSIDRASYEEAHIPGALWVDHIADLLRNGDESSGYVLTPEQFAALMERLGIAPGMMVVWYGDRHSAFATRGFWTCDYYRHPGGYHVLDGGSERWLAEGRPVTADATQVEPARYDPPSEVHRAGRASADDVRAAIDDPHAVVLDVRSLEEYDGRNRRARRGGHVPGAVHIEWTEATAAPNVLKPAGELRKMYEADGVTPDKTVIAHCQLGVRASHTWFVLKHVLGYPDVRNYDGSWQEWGNRDDLPVER